MSIDRYEHGQVSVTASAQQVTAEKLEVGTFILKAHPKNRAEVFIGKSDVTTTNGWWLVPGEDFVITYSNTPGIPVIDLRPDELWIVGTAGDSLAWIATPR